MELTRQIGMDYSINRCAKVDIILMKYELNLRKLSNSIVVFCIPIIIDRLRESILYSTYYVLHSTHCEWYLKCWWNQHQPNWHCKYCVNHRLHIHIALVIIIRSDKTINGNWTANVGAYIHIKRTMKYQTKHFLFCRFSAIFRLVHGIVKSLSFRNQAFFGEMLLRRCSHGRYKKKVQIFRCICHSCMDMGIWRQRDKSISRSQINCLSKELLKCGNIATS